MVNTIGPGGTTTPLMRFSGSNVLPNFKDCHTFGCPVYALDGDLASGKKIAHWRPSARIGINLGFSPCHARTVSLVLNTQTGNVSLQFHIRHGDFSATVRGSCRVCHLKHHQAFRSTSSFYRNIVSTNTIIINKQNSITSGPFYCLSGSARV